ncbi:ATP-binding protein [Salibacterium salarium]|uniref:ATP-binding protein n=1 Tax=Salibacterium salarium TaxID=284579 RepID=UPI0027D87BE5|nr:ATP-binding protein [Salibacterium salarium]
MYSAYCSWNHFLSNTKKDLTNRIEQTLFMFSDNLAFAVEDIISERLTDLEQLSQNPVLMNEDAEDEEIQEEFLKFIDNHDLYYGLIFVNRDGLITVDTDGTVVGNNVEEREWFQEANDGSLFLSDIFMSSVVDNPILAMASGVKNEEGEVIGVISPSFDLEYLWSFLWKRIDQYSEEQENINVAGETFLLNESGDYIAHPDSDNVLERNFLNETNSTLTSMQGLGADPGLIHNEKEETVNAIAPIGHMEGFDNNWYVGLSVPADEMYAPLRDLLFKYLLLFSIVLLITITAVFKLSRYIVEPVERLVSATNDFAVGKKVLPLQSNAYEEINKLTRTFNDMTKRLEEREKAHRKSTLIIETTDNGVISINRNNAHITTFNRTCEKLFQLDKEDVIGRSLFSLIDHHSDFKAFMNNVYFNRENEHTSRIYEFDCDIQGENHAFFLSMTPLPTIEDEEQIEDILLVFKEVTEKKEMEKELLRSEKLKVIGKLASGFAHEIRNPLTTIRGFMQLYKETDDKKVDNYHYHIILSEIDRVNSIVEDLLTIAKPDREKEKTNVQVNDILVDTLYLFHSQAKTKEITTNYKLDPSLPHIYAEEKKLKQVVMNLIKNAIEAIPENGHIHVSSESVTENEVQGIIVRIEDNGEGMTQETLEKLGSPFYTTKKDGTGLGLMTCFQIVEESGGSIQVDSEQRKGTVFKIWLPLR